MGYSDVVVRVMLMCWAPCMLILGQLGLLSTYHVWDVQAEGMP